MKHPRMDFRRENFLDLNGEWEFDFDDEDIGELQTWYKGHVFSKKITVPYPYQSELSGVNDKSYHRVVWYRKTVGLNSLSREKRLFLILSASDFHSTVWFNGEYAGEHYGGYTPAEFEIRKSISEDKLGIVVRVEDYNSPSQPRGKQEWRQEEPSGIFYTPVTGIWQPAYIEERGRIFIKETRIYKEGEYIKVKVFLSDHAKNFDVKFSLTKDEKVVLESKKGINGKFLILKLKPSNLSLWSPEDPNLYDFEVSLEKGDEVVDKVSGYTGFRTIKVKKESIFLNGKEVYFKFLLDQGYYPGGIYFPKDEKDFENDIRVLKEMGFNGVRKHQKIESPIWLYYADKIGIFVWEEMPSFYVWSEAAKELMKEEWQEAIRRDFNHPSIVAWVPFNECWGISNVYESKEQQRFVKEIYNITKRLDPTRLVVDNSGYVHVKTDIIDIHDYDSAGFKSRWEAYLEKKSEIPCPLPLFAKGIKFAKRPIVISEYGGLGIAEYPPQVGREFPYKKLLTKDEFLKWYEDITQNIKKIPVIKGYCYTQFYDVEQEVNGLLTFDRKPKISIEAIRKINS
jgi:beta-galactosidase/beta-glucuronidase